MESREALQDALSAYEGTVVLVSHDVEFVRAVAQGIVAVSPEGGGVRRYSGGYDYYREKTAVEADGLNESARPVDAAKAEQQEAFRDRKALKAELRRVEKETAALEQQIGGLEATIGELHEQLAAVDTAADRRALAGRELKDVEERLAECLAAWEEVGKRRDELVARIESVAGV